MNPAADQLALELARWSWYARDALAGAELAHDACAERVRRLDARTDTAALVAQQLQQRCDREGERLAGTFAALVGARRRGRERAEALSALLVRIDASVAHWTAQLASAERAGDAHGPRSEACRRALREIDDARLTLSAAVDGHARAEATLDDALRKATEAAAALQQARSAAGDAVEPSGSPATAAHRLLSDAQGHIDVARVVHDEAQRLAASARHRVGGDAGDGRSRRQVAEETST